MYKAVIIDDNIFDNRGICDMLQSLNLDIEITGRFFKADEALTEIPKLNPDIILTDIFMPGISGIEMMKSLRSSGLTTHTIFMSSYDDFDYAKAGIDLGVDYYLLKPFFEDDLKKAVLKVIFLLKSEMSQKETLNNALAELEKSKPLLETFFLRQLLYGNICSEEEIEHQINFLNIDIMNNESFCVSVLHLISGTDISDYLISLTLTNQAAAVTSDNMHVFSFLDSKHTHILMFNGNKSRKDFNNFVLDFLLSVKECLSFVSSNADIQFGLSQIRKGISELPELFSQAKTCIDEKYLSENSDIIIYDQIENSNELSFFSNFDYISLYNSIKEILVFSKDENIPKLIKNTFSSTTHIYPRNYLICWISVLTSTIRIVLHEMNVSFDDNDWNSIINSRSTDNISSVSETLSYSEYIFSTVQSRLMKKTKSEHYEIAEKIKAFIKTNYMNPINVSDISDVIFLSSKYANKIFKKVEGVTIFDYLLQYRIEKAKILLREENSKIYSVAANVGYSNISHFCHIFKKFTGMSPASYKNNFNSKE